MLLHQNKAQICFESFEVSKLRLIKNASEFQDVSVREFQFDENRKAGGTAFRERNVKNKSYTRYRV